MFDVYEKPRKKSKKKINKRNRKRNQNNPKSFIIFTILFLIILIFYSYNRINNSNYRAIKIKKDEYLVYTKKELHNNYDIVIPYINIKSNAIGAVNKEIDYYLKPYLEKQESTNISYQYSINGKILSILLKIVDYDTEYAPNVIFKSFHVNLKRLEEMYDDDLLRLYGITKKHTEERIEETLKSYHDELIKLEYYEEEECDYSCFLSQRGINDYLEGIAYYIENGELYAYKPFIFSSIYGEEEFFREKHYRILLSKPTKE